MAEMATMSARTRSLRKGEPSLQLEDRHLRVGPEDLLERVDYLTFRGMYARALQKVRHQVRVRARRHPRELRQLALDRSAVAARAHAAHSVDLLALERRVDVQELDRALVEVPVVVDADDDPFRALDLLLQPERGVGDLALREALLDRLHHPAQLVDLGEVLV